MALVLASLTAEQTASLPAHRDKWMAIGLSTDPADRRRAESAIRLAYQRAGLKGPDILTWLGSPMAGAIGYALIKEYSQKRGGASVRASVRASVWASVRDSVRDSVWASVGDSVRASAGASVGDSVGASVWASVGDSVRASAGASVGDSVGASVWDSVGASVWDSVGDSVWASVRDSVGDSVWASGYGSHDAAWIGFYATLRAFGVRDQTDKLDGLTELTRSCGWYWPFQGLCILTERPNRLQRDDRGRLHSGDGLAIAYPDGWGVYAWHGIRVAEGIILHPGSITAEAVKAEQNAEVRRVMLERMGEDRFVREGGAELIHRDGFGELYRMDESTLAVKVINSTPEPDGHRKVYWLYPHPELRPMRRSEGGPVELGNPQELTAHAAVASTFGLRASEYRPVFES